MAETAQTMTEFTYAPGEKNIVGDRFSPSVIIFWLKTSIAASSTRVQYKAPNTLFGLIPLGASTKTIPLRNIASVDTNTRFNLGSLVWGLIFLFVGFGRRLTAGKRVTVKTEHGLGRMLPDPSVYRITKTGNPDKDVARIPI